MKKVIAILLSAILPVCLVGCGKQDLVLDEAKTYEVTSEIHSLDIRINAADFKIERGEDFSVVSNLKNLKVDAKDGCLTVIDSTKTKVELIHDTTYEDAMLTVYVPDGTVFEAVRLETGAGRFTVDTLCAETLDLEFGAGNVTVGTLVATRSVDIEGGAGSISVSGGALNDLELEMGVGELNLTSTLSGDCQLNMGVGESNITLIGNREDYDLAIKKGLGAISVDGRDVSDFHNSGNGTASVEISGGVGSINVNFDAPKAGSTS